jgi:hypothetical protein
MNYSNLKGTDAPNFATNGRLPDSSAVAVSELLPDSNLTETDYRTWNWAEAATEINVNESTLRKIWWEADLAPAFRYCPTPLRTVPRVIKKSGREISEFTAFGIEILKAYKAAKAKGDRVAELFLAEAKAKYVTPASANTQSAHKPHSHSVEVDCGNHQLIRQSPNLLQGYTLQNLRRDQSIQFEDPLGIAQQFLAVAEQIQTSMQSDLEQREDKLNQTRKAREVIANKAQELKLETRLYQERTHQVDTAQTQETEALQEALHILNRLGKSAVGSGSPS